jgi:hypothetical protein
LQDTLTDILKTFAEIFGKKYVLYLVQSVKEEANPPEQPDLVLEDVPDGGSIPSAPLKAGYFVKVNFSECENFHCPDCFF